MVETVNLEAGKPYVADALDHLAFALRRAKSTKTPVVKLIHGYGSTGTGGRIRTEVRAALSGMKGKGQIKDFVCGEDFSIFSAVTREAFKTCPELRRDRDLERGNRGVTFVIL